SRIPTHRDSRDAVVTPRRRAARHRRRRLAAQSGRRRADRRGSGSPSQPAGRRARGPPARRALALLARAVAWPTPRARRLPHDRRDRRRAGSGDADRRPRSQEGRRRRRWGFARRPRRHRARQRCARCRARRARGSGSALRRRGRGSTRRRRSDVDHPSRARARRPAGGHTMTGGRVLATAVVTTFASGAGACAQPASTGPARGATWRTEVSWPFSLGVRGPDTVVSGGRNRILALDTMTGRERWRAEVTQVTHYEPALDDATVLVSADDRVVAL